MNILLIKNKRIMIDCIYVSSIKLNWNFEEVSVISDLFIAFVVIGFFTFIN